MPVSYCKSVCTFVTVIYSIKITIVIHIKQFFNMVSKGKRNKKALLWQTASTKTSKITFKMSSLQICVLRLVYLLTLKAFL